MTSSLKNLAILIALSMASCVNAGTITSSETVNFSFSSNTLEDYQFPNYPNPGAEASDTYGPISFTNFDNNLGTLVNAQLRLNSTASYSVTFGSWTDNWDYNSNYKQYIAVSGNSGVTHQVSIFDTGKTTVNSDSITASCSGYVTYNCHADEYKSKNISQTFNLDSMAQSVFENDLLEIDLHKFMHSDITTCYGMTSSGCQGWFNNYWAGSFTLSYTYEREKPSVRVSEPGSLALLGLGLAGLGFVRRKPRA